jgi:hypothetical protein
MANLPVDVQVKELSPGDHIKLLGAGEYTTATVYQKSPDGDCKVWRPYVHTADFTYGDNRVVPYVGIEDFTIHAWTTVTLLRRADPKR